MFKFIFITFFILLSLIISSCGIYNLDFSIKNPLDGINVFQWVSNNKSDLAKETQCRIEIDKASWSKAVSICKTLDMSKSSNRSLYASALQGKNGGDAFNLLKAAAGDYESIFDGFIANLGSTTENSLAELDQAISLLESIPNKTDEQYFQLAFAQFTLACAIINSKATANGNPGELTANDIEDLSNDELDEIYDLISSSVSNLLDAEMTGSITESIQDILDNEFGDEGVFKALSEEEKQDILKGLFGV